MANPNTIDWLHYQDVQIPDLSVKQQFQAYMSEGNYVEALELLEMNEQKIKGKAYIANALNKILNGILFLEGEFDNGVNRYLSNLAVFYFNLIDNLRDMREWNSTLAYNRYNFVHYQDNVYMAIADNVTEKPIQGNKWVELNLKGKDGAHGVGLTMRYTWSNNRQYEYGDIVAYERNLYVALKRNKGVTPGTNEATWLTFLLVGKGKIHVGMNAPAEYVQNSVWFKTEKDPLVKTAQPIKGVFQRYVSDGIWEEMYPTTIFTWVEGYNNYAKKPEIGKVVIEKSDWSRDSSGAYSVRISNARLREPGFFKVILNDRTEEKVEFYSTLNVEVGIDAFIFTTQTKPKLSLTLTIITE